MHPVIWMSPDTDPATKSPGRFAEQLAPKVRIIVTGLQVWDLPDDAQYSAATEVDGIRRLAGAEGLDRFHIFGFSAAGTAALATALAMPERILSIALLEPATIGSDAFDSAEAEWQAEMRQILALPDPQRGQLFERFLMRPGIDPPAGDRTWRLRPQDKMLEEMIAAPGFESDDLCLLPQPTLVAIGANSNPRWEHVAKRLEKVMPRVRTVVFPGLDHFQPPHRVRPGEFERVLVDFWRHAEPRD